MSKLTIVAAIAAVLIGVPASAQTANETFFVGVSAGGVLNSSLVTSQATATIYGQQAALNERRDVSGSPMFELTVGKPIRGRFAIGATASIRAATSDSAIAATVPHPLFFGQPRSVLGEATEMKSTQTWIGLLAIYTLPSSSALRIRLFGGPALAAVKHDTAGGFTVTETSNLAAPAIALSRGSVSRQFWGAVGGIDVSVALNGSVGLGGFVRYAGAPANVTGAESGTLGGVEAGGGLRFNFRKH